MPIRNFCLSTAQHSGIVTFVMLLFAYLAPGWALIVPDVGYEDNILVARVFSILHCSVSVPYFL